MAKDGFMDLGTAYSGTCCPGPENKIEERVDYPTIYIRGKNAPKLPEGEFTFVCKGKVVGYRDPIDRPDDKSCEIAVMSIKVKGEDSGDIKDAFDKVAKKKKYV